MNNIIDERTENNTEDMTNQEEKLTESSDGDRNA